MHNTDKLFEFIAEGVQTAVESLLNQDPDLINAKNAAGVPAVLFAQYGNQSKIVKIFLDHGVEVDGFTAAAIGDTPRLKDLIADKPEWVNAVAPDGFSPLGLAAFFGKLANARLLVDHGADVNAPSQNPQKVRPLHSAVAGKNLEIARLLLEHGADVNARQADDFTPLQGAAQNGQVKMIKLLLDHGADGTARSADGKTAADLVHRNPEAEALLRKFKR
jgi:uncharacterized protein